MSDATSTTTASPVAAVKRPMGVGAKIVLTLIAIAVLGNLGKFVQSEWNDFGKTDAEKYAAIVKRDKEKAGYDQYWAQKESEKEAAKRAKQVPQVSTAKPEPVRSAAGTELVDRCVSVARDLGFRSARCAYNLITTCISTQSKSEIEIAFRVANMMDIVRASSCPNMPDTFESKFDRF